MNGVDVSLPILRLTDIRKTLPTGRRLLEIDELCVHAGRCLLLTGPNGVVKTTLLKILSRITEPTHGRAELRGRVASLLEVGTGFHPELTGDLGVHASVFCAAESAMAA